MDQTLKRPCPVQKPVQQATFNKVNKSKVCHFETGGSVPVAWLVDFLLFLLAAFAAFISYGIFMCVRPRF